MAKAIEAFESTLTTPNSRFNQFLAGKETLNGAELSNDEVKAITLFLHTLTGDQNKKRR